MTIENTSGARPEHVAVLERWLEASPSVVQSLFVRPPRSEREEQYLEHIRCPGYFRTTSVPAGSAETIGGVIFVVPRLCTQPGHGYSWPRHRSDRTELGVLAHELGHHVHMTRPDFGRIREASVWRMERVSGYEPNPDESFAETFRLFLLNPDLLREGRPGRYDYLLSLGLSPTEERPWRECLGDAPVRILLAAEAWLAERPRRPHHTQTEMLL